MSEDVRSELEARLESMTELVGEAQITLIVAGENAPEIVLSNGDLEEAIRVIRRIQRRRRRERERPPRHAVATSSFDPKQ